MQKSSCGTADSFDIHPIGKLEILQMLSTVRTKTATGPDELSASLLKQIAPAIVENVVKIMNTSVMQGVFLAGWKKANVAVIWKNKGSKSDPASYRLISNNYLSYLSLAEYSKRQ